MKTIILFLLLFSIQDIEYKFGKPTTKGIDYYVDLHWFDFIEDFEASVQDSIFGLFISTDNLRGYEQHELGYFQPPNSIVVTNEERYIDYELNMMSDFKKSQYRETNQFVRAIVMHEICHAYFYQLLKLCDKGDSLEYEFRLGLHIVPQDFYGTEFCEEGICEYVVETMGERIAYDEKVRITANKLINNRNSYEVKYRYASQFVKPIVDSLGIRNAILTIVSNKPPSNEEILKPEFYYKRIRIK